MKGTKFISLILLLCFSFSIVAYAATEEDMSNLIGLSTSLPRNPESGIIAYDINPPDKDSVYSNNTWHTVRGESTRNELYTDRCFKNVTKIEYDMTNHSSSTLTQSLRRFVFFGHLQVSSSKISGNSSSTGSFTNLDTDEIYFIRYSAPVNASGKVKGSN